MVLPQYHSINDLLVKQKLLTVDVEYVQGDFADNWVRTSCWKHYEGICLETDDYHSVAAFCGIQT